MFGAFGSTPARWGVVELAGCSDLPDVFEVHHCVSEPGYSEAFDLTDGPTDPSCGDESCWNGFEWFTLASRPGSGGADIYIPWEDNDPEVDECNEPCHHGRGTEAFPVQCGEIVKIHTYAECDAGVCNYINFPTWWSIPLRMTPDADVDDDGVVASTDLGALYACWEQPASCNPAADLNHDGVISGEDYAALYANWARTLSSYTILGHTQWYYDDHYLGCAPSENCCPSGVICHATGGHLVPWIQSQ